MMNDIQRDVDEIDFLVAEFAGIEITAAWQRLKPRLTPDRERVARAIHDANTTGLRGEDVWLARADAAIKAMGGNDDA